MVHPHGEALADWSAEAGQGIRVVAAGGGAAVVEVASRQERLVREPVAWKEEWTVEDAKGEVHAHTDSEEERSVAEDLAAVGCDVAPAPEGLHGWEEGLRNWQAVREEVLVGVAVDPACGRGAVEAWRHPWGEEDRPFPFPSLDHEAAQAGRPFPFRDLAEVEDHAPWLAVGWEAYLLQEDPVAVVAHPTKRLDR